MKINLESYAHIDESAKIQGVALIPRISRNHNLYTKEELRRFDGVKVPLNWEHDPSKVIGSATFHYNSENETVYYEGEITDQSAAMLAKNKTLFTSIEATPTSVQQVCNGNGTSDCFAMPFGLRPEGLALTETPGVPETSVIIEKYLAECNDPSMHKTLKKDKDGNFVEEGLDNPADRSDDIMMRKLQDMAKGIESQLKNKEEALELFKRMHENNPEPVIADQIAILENDIGFLTNQLIQIRKDSEYVSVESLDDIVRNMKEKYVCDCCGDLKKKKM